jgi:HK97 family phage major capsid protein
MALRQLIISKKLETLRTQLDAARAKETGFETRKKDLEKREAELEAAVNEVTDETSEEDKKSVDDSVTAFESEKAALEKEEADNTVDKQKLEDEIRDLETELNDLNARSKTPPAAPAKSEKREDVKSTMKNRTKIFETMDERDAFFARDDIKDFLVRVRGLGVEKRAVSGGELGIPEVMLDLLRDNMTRYSKLITRVRLKPVKGKARQNVAGTVPEGIWIEAIANLNELELSFSQVEVDGYKVGGYIPIPNSTLEDDDNLQLGMEILDMLGQAIGLGVDKAIPYGTGVKMPVGAITRLAATSEPSYWGTNQGAFTDLHSTHILKLNIDGSTGAAFFASLIVALGVADPRYSDGKATWLMNRATHIALMAKALAFDAAAALVAGMNNTMPVIGGDIVELEFMADKEIFGGFFSLYLLAERAGGKVQSSDIPLFIQDQTVFKGTARYDGKPVRGEAFVMISYDNTDPTTSISFSTDYANAALGTLIVTTAASASTTGKSAITIAGSQGGTLKYKLAGAPLAVSSGGKAAGYTAITSGTEIVATTGSYITVVEVDGAGKIVGAGSGVVTSKA